MAKSMRQMRSLEVMQEFIAWQCRIRQHAVRHHDGLPMDGMRPRVSSKTGVILANGLMTLLVPLQPAQSLAFLRFQVQKTADPRQTREAVLRYLAGEFFQLPELFSDQLTAVFAPGSETARGLLRRKEVLMDFEQFSQVFRMFARVKVLGARDEAREFSLWQARAFNRNIPNDALVLAFRPDWKSAVSAAR